ncbi:P-loop containing nucleoside triphosphate hydrolase protein [Jimgerdemannia flammicorona]|uniref:P-loop containing nucleoside triphosphate hydrolase protein n=1 Tax=Jimgerdemannia flammicorona TaxID=994334 RepID=A0A433QKA0_9FUNG|nr:P-loop containing nucleoside triphosphate hydrolase protein [Jimgerdemannia flammicorona]
MVSFYNNSPASFVIGVNFKTISAPANVYDIHANHTVFSGGFINTRFATMQSYLDRAIINVKRQSLNLPLLSSPLPSKSTDPGTNSTGYGRSFISTAFFVGQTPAFSINAYIGSYYLIFAFQSVWVNILNLVIQEKFKKIKQTMLTMGLSQSAYMASIFVVHSTLGALTCILVMVICYAGKIFWFSHWFLVFVLLLLFVISVTAVGYIFAIPFSNPKSVIFGSWLPTLIFLACYAASFFTLFNSPDNTVAKETATYLISGIAFGRAIDYISNSELTLVGVTFGNIQYTPLPRIYGMLILDIILYGLLAWYLERVFPGEGSHPLPWNFIFRRSFWGFPSNQTKTNMDVQNGGPDNNAAPNDMIELFDVNAIPLEDRGTIKMVNLTKKFKIAGGSMFKKSSENVALDGLSLELHKNETLGLLGHNDVSFASHLTIVRFSFKGAGKTTAISILTGAIFPTSGTITINGTVLPSSRDNSDDLHSLHLLHSTFGVCPQHDVLFTQLSAYETLEVFAAIKGVVVLSRNATEDGEDDRENETAQQLLKSYIMDLLDDVYLKDKADNRIETFSGGMKRKLSVAIAFLGDPTIVLLDEPTTGMVRIAKWDDIVCGNEKRPTYHDVYSRKQVWQLMQDSKAGRTIILTTHSMEEADALGDRIAIISKGKLQTLGTSLYLKNRFGVGYHLNLEKLQDAEQSTALFNETEVTALVKEYFPDASVLSNTAYDITYILPLGSSSNNPISDEDSITKPEGAKKLEIGSTSNKSKPQNPVPRHGTIDISHSTSTFPQFFERLNREMEAKDGLGVASVGLGLTTLEEVFLRLQKEQEQE